MKSILIIGGTKFVGRHIAQQAIERGHKVTLFNRGQTNADLFPEAEHLRGNRRNDLSALGSRSWDAVVDVCGYTRGEVAFTVKALAERTQHYVFISSVSAYASYAKPNDENSPLGVIDDVDTEVIDGRTYGPLKAACEKEVLNALGHRALILRPGLVVGPHDPTDRFTYWIARVLRGGAMLAPRSPQYSIQFIDVSALSMFANLCIDQAVYGIFNVVNTAGRDTLGALLSTTCKLANVSPTVEWLPQNFLEERKVAAWNELPLWLPANGMPEMGDATYFMASSNAAALARGLQCPPLEETVAATMNWFQSLPAERRAQLKAGLSAERESALLQAWHLHSSNA